MKKIISVILICVLTISMTACASKAASTDEVQEESVQIEDVQSEDAQPENAQTKVLVAYFSRTGNTRPLAEYVGEYYQGDIFEIKAKNPYSDEDIDYTNNNSRTSIEQNDPSSRPEIEDAVENMEQYDMIVLAYPIWWGQAPRIIDTFLESYDFSGKTIIPFCTSASSDIGTSDDNLYGFVDDSVSWVEGKRFPAGTSKEEMVEWLQGLEIK